MYLQCFLNIQNGKAELMITATNILHAFEHSWFGVTFFLLCFFKYPFRFEAKWRLIESKAFHIV
jgi:hypothetical protein